MNDIAISVKHLTKVYHLYHNPIDRLKESLHPFRKKYHAEHYSLNNVSFDIKKGETVGIIGKNGAGKSTLLKIITGVLTPTSGSMQVNGKIASLLELGAGFNPDYTGLENVYFQGMLMGYSRAEMTTKLGDILAFADIGDFIHQPVRTYSSGMFARLAFSVAINVDPDILIVDEALSVGDVRFQQKCFRKIRNLQLQRKTILLVTHDISSVVNYCSQVVWLSDGTLQAQGDPETITQKYLSVMNYDQASDITENEGKVLNSDQITSTDDRLSANYWVSTEGLESFGERKLQILQVALLNDRNESQQVFKGGEQVYLLLNIHAHESLEDLIVGFVVNDYLGNAIFGSNSHLHDRKILSFQADHDYVVEFYFSVPSIKNGEYTISPAIAEGSQGEHIQHHWVHNALVFNINNQSEEANIGWLLMNPSIKIKVK